MRQTDYQSAVYEYLEPLLLNIGFQDTKISFAYQLAPELEGNFVVLNIQNFNPIGSPQPRLKYDKQFPTILTEHIYSNFEVVLSIDMFGDNCIFRANQLQALLQSDYGIELSRKYKLGFVSVSEITNISHTYKGKYIPRCFFNFVNNYSYIFYKQITTIGQVRVKGENWDNGDVITDVTVTE